MLRTQGTVPPSFSRAARDSVGLYKMHYDVIAAKRVLISGCAAGCVMFLTAFGSRISLTKSSQ